MLLVAATGAFPLEEFWIEIGFQFFDGLQSLIDLAAGLPQGEF